MWRKALSNRRSPHNDSFYRKIDIWSEVDSALVYRITRGKIALLHYKDTREVRAVRRILGCRDENCDWNDRTERLFGEILEVAKLFGVDIYGGMVKQ